MQKKLRKITEKKLSRQIINNDLKGKLNFLSGLIREYQKVVIAYSGGIDSTVLLKISIDVLGKENVVAVVGKSPTLPKALQKVIDSIKNEFGIEVIEVNSEEMKDPNFYKNPPDRCYYCKKELMSRIREVARKHSIEVIFDGSNYDDFKNDYRPGIKALKEFGIKSPLAEAGITKTDIYNLAKYFDLPNKELPPTPCLASRVPYYTEITEEILKKIDEAEQIIRDTFGITHVRVRYHKEIAKIEVDKVYFKRFLDPKATEKVISKIKGLGFYYVTLDLEGYKTGSLNIGILKSGEKYVYP